MPEDNIIEELEEISQLVEESGGSEKPEDVKKELEEIEKIAASAEDKKDENKGSVAASATVATATAKKAPEKKEEKKSKEEQKPEKEEEKKKEEKKEEKPSEKQLEEKKSEGQKPEVKPAPEIKQVKAPEKAIHGSGFKFGAGVLVVIGIIIYAAAFYLRWEGWHIISHPPSSVIALTGTLLILAGGEVYYRGKVR